MIVVAALAVSVKRHHFCGREVKGGGWGTVSVVLNPSAAWQGVKQLPK